MINMTFVFGSLNQCCYGNW